MNICKGFSKLWFLGVLLVAFLTGCGGNDSVVTTNSNKAITAYSVAGATGTVNESAKTITVTVPAGTNVTAQVATFTTTGAGVKVGSLAQKSATTPNDFTTPVKYTVTATDNTAVDYMVTVAVALVTDKSIIAYSFTGVSGAVGTITETATPKTIAVNVPIGTDVTKLAATFSITGSSVKVGTAVQASGTTLNDFTNPVIYTVFAADTSTVDYTVTVTQAAAKIPAAVNLGAAGNYVILATSKVSTVPSSAITGDIGLSPAATTFLTGFSLTMVGTTSATSLQVTGHLYGADMTTPTSSNLTTAVNDMRSAYTDAAGRPTPDVLNLGTGEIGGKTILPGLYKWTTAVTVSSDVIISGGPTDVWIFQIPGNLTMNPAKNITLAGGAKARNIFWQVAGAVDMGTTAHFEGIVLSKTSITMGTGASINGRLLAQTAVDLDQNAVTQPAP